METHRIIFDKLLTKNICNKCEMLLQSEMIMQETVIKSNETLDKQIKSLEDVFNKIKDSLLVHTYREMFSR